jgi:hypothetical protein
MRLSSHQDSPQYIPHTQKAGDQLPKRVGAGEEAFRRIRKGVTYSKLD